MAFNINDFQGEFLGGGARTNLFEVNITFPNQVLNAATAGNKLRFVCRGAQVPGRTVNVVEVPYFGRIVKFAGDSTFEDWTTTIYNDEDHLVKDALENWTGQLNGGESNLRPAEAALTTGYQATAQVIRYGKTGEVIKTIDIIGIFPTVIDAVDLNWDNGSTVEEYGVTFTYQYWRSNSSG